MKKNITLSLLVLFCLIFGLIFSCTKERTVYVGNGSSNIQIQSVTTEKQLLDGYKVTVKWIDLDSAINTKYLTTRFDLNNQIPPFNDTINTRALTLHNVPEAQPIVLRIVSEPKIDCTKIRFKIVVGNVDITIFSKW